MAQRKTIIGIVGADGTGRTTLAKMLAEKYRGTAHSVNQHLLGMYYDKYKNTAAPERSDIIKFANELRRKNSLAAAIRPLVMDALKDKESKLDIIESLYCPGEIAFLQKKCGSHKVDLILIGLCAFSENRVKWLDQTKQFQKMNKHPTDLHVQEWAEWCSASPWMPSLTECMSMIPEELIFINESSIKHVFWQIEEKLQLAQWVT